MSNSVKESMKVNIEHVCDALLDLGASAEMALSSGSRARTFNHSRREMPSVDSGRNCRG